MPIVNFTGEELLNAENLEAIKKEADLILQNKDVAAAWQGSRHIKAQLAALPGDKIKPVLGDYRRLTANLKALALPLLGWDEVKSLITNNLTFLDAKYLPATGAALAAWLSTQTDADQSGRRSELLKLLPPDSQLCANLTASKLPVKTPGPSAINPVQVLAIGSDVLFDKAEAAELVSHIEKVNDIGGAPLSLSGSAAVAENIFNISQSQEDKESFGRRAKALIASRLRDVRTQAELREYLGRPFKVGGLGLAGDVLEKAGALIEDEYNKLHSHTPAVTAPPTARRDPVAVMETPLPASVASRPARFPSESVTAEPIIPKEEPVKTKPAPEMVAPPIPPKPAAKNEPVPDAVRVVRPLRLAPANDKPRVEDIKSSSRTISAVDELKFLTLADWRKYGAPEEAVKNILQKIRLLGEESVVSKLQGIKMFRASELFQQYLALGRASLSQGKKLAEALADKTVNPNNMTEDEFFAIALLNGKLK